MMKAFQFIFALLITGISGLSQGSELTVLTYHDVVANPTDDAYAVSRSAFVAQMDYLETHGYKPVSLEFLDRVSKQQATLPKNAVLLTFDDGLQSYYQFVAPVLKTYNFPSVLSVVSVWADGKNTPPEYRGKLLSWDKLKQLEKSPLVEIISHTHDLHTNVQSNPQGNYAPAGVTRIYSPVEKRYESEREFRQRIAADLKNSVTRFKQELNIEPKGIAWPYGRYDDVMSAEARLLGMEYQLTLDDGPNTELNLPVLNRIMVMRDTAINDFVADLNYEPFRSRTHHFVEIKLDQFSGKSSKEQEKLLSSMLDNIESMEVNTVILYPVSKDGKMAFFPTQQMDVAADVMNRVSHQLNSRLGIRHIYLRLPGSVQAKNIEIFYNDMARLAWFNGVVFDQHQAQQQDTIRKIVEYYHPKSQFGHLGNTPKMDDYDFLILPVAANQPEDELRKQVLKAKGLPTRLFIQVKVDDDHTESVPGIIDTIRALGIKHYGIALQKDLYGFDNNISITKELAKGTLAVFGG